MPEQGKVRENSGDGSFSISTGKSFFMLGYGNARQIEPLHW